MLRRRPLPLSLTVVAAVSLFAISPTVVRVVNAASQRAEVTQDRTMPPALARESLEHALNAEPLVAPRPTEPLMRVWAVKARAYAAALNANDIGDARLARLMERFWTVFSAASAELGPDVAAAAADLLTTEARNVQLDDGRASAFATPEGSLIAAERWLSFVPVARRLARLAPASTRPRTLALALAAAAPYPMQPRAVLENARWVRRAANIAVVPSEVLAAIVDNEQAGGALAYGLSSALRGIVDTLSLRAARETGSSGWIGRLSRTIGLTQMSWEDALAQRPRFHALGARFGVAFPRTEVEARVLLGQPYANLLLSASRLRGYLNGAAHLDPLSTQVFDRGWTYVFGPAWHNRPDLASSGQTSSYQFNAFFKACVYAEVLKELRP